MTAPIEAITGYRVFHVFGDRLQSYSSFYEWTPGKNVAVCRLDGKGLGLQHGPVPAARCGCGFWMYKDLSRAAWMFRDLLLADEDEDNGSSRFGCFGPRAPVVILVESRGWGTDEEEERQP
jgi:hypothetical protein